MSFVHKKLLGLVVLSALLLVVPKLHAETEIWQRVAMVEATALVAAWYAGTSRDADTVLGVSYIAAAPFLASMTDLNGSGKVTLMAGMVALGLYNFELHDRKADRDERRRANFVGVNAIALAVWLIDGITPSAQPTAAFNYAPWFSYDSVGVQAEYRF